ncbi:hypothetical protein DMA15_34530 [Streptomyces sp. WAC 01529]|uniref:hypothetical protein n=1 Tax=Streptomyces sp. WAC 01529 TaxID=2203205 RepID=UPI000F6B6B0A|nr:hypothetical protein [Streptomyces sp. WAC 01529]AZM57055.1 hypothetical protein DMA15_34530 [Streptomyces sp. WAC 01529]
MPELLSREEVPVEVDFYGFALQDFDDAQVPSLFPEGWEQGPYLTSLPGRLDFTSGGHTHTATLVIEVWDTEPSAPSGNWEESALGEITCTSGKLEARGVAGGPMPEPITLSESGAGIWKVRAVSSGREEVKTKAHHGVPEGVERYVLQFWPRS